MACFSEEANKLFVDFKKGELRDRLVTAYDETLKRQVDAVEYGDPEALSLKPQARANTQLLGQALLHRGSRLIQAVGPMLVAKNLYGLALVCRGHVEATAGTGYFCYRIRSLQRGDIDLKRYAEDVAWGLMGARHSLFSEAKPSANIVTCVEKTDKFLDTEYFKKKVGMMADVYGWLSEFAHPNFCSNLCAFRLEKHENRMVIRHDDDLSDDNFQLVQHMELSAELLPKLFDELQARSEAILSA
jgi:hypothetical protein